jgi:CHAT domain-containing protein
LPAFPLLCAPLDDAAAGPHGTSRWTTVADRLQANVAPSARILAVRPSGHARSGLYALGDPRPTDQELRWAEAEALTAATLAGDPTRARVHEAATRAWLVDGLQSGQVVDASCHGQFDGRDFSQSRLLLANQETLTLADVIGNEVDIAGLRLLVLSACQTAVMDIRGARGEVRSLAAGMLQAGARSVMAPLWAVDDRATYLLMVRFMQEWLPVMDQASPTGALSRAQSWLRSVTNRELVAWAVPEVGGSEATLVSVRGRGDRYSMSEAEQLVTGLARRSDPGDLDETPYADPIFWAGFQVLGP